MARLVVEDGSGRTRDVEVGSTRVTIGRGKTCGVALRQAAASREHCAIEKDARGHWLTDLGSRNGTRLNGRRVARRALLRTGDRIEIGAARLVYHEGPEDALARDPETGLRSYAFARAELGRRLEAGEELAVAKLDVDGLGLVNDVLGVESGDGVIVAVAREVEAAVLEVERDAIVAREAGGKLLVLLPGRDAERAREVADVARARVSAPSEEPVSRVTLSGGVAASPRDGTAPHVLLRAAEAALAEAKRAGRDRVALPGERAPLDGARESDATVSDARADEPAIGGREGQRALALVASVLASDLDVDGLAELALSVIVKETGAARGLLVLRDEHGALRLGAAVAPRGQAAAPASHGLLGLALDRGGLLVRDAQADADLARIESVVSTGVRSVVAAPIALGATTLGVVYLEDDASPDRFDARSLALVRAFGRLVAGPIRRGLLHRRALDELARSRLALAGTREDDARLFAKFRAIVGRGKPLARMLKEIERAADRTFPVLVTGESGTGKELVARALHARSRRASGPFLAESCAALSDELLDAELFGHRKGAFTGADRDRPGILEAADGGTLFLDEVGEMSPRMQAKLLRFLQEGELRPLGGEETRKVSVRVVAATHRDLAALVREGSFREDLYFRLAVLKLEVPPLRERREDIPLLVEHFAARVARESSRPAPRFSPDALAVLAGHAWPGNVRQLENEVRKLASLGVEVVEPSHLSAEIAGDAPERAAGKAREAELEAAAGSVVRAIASGRSFDDALDDLEREVVGRILEQTGGNRSETARRLGLSRPGLRKKMRRLKVTDPAPRKTKKED